MELGQELSLGALGLVKPEGVRECEQEGWSSEKTEENTETACPSMSILSSLVREPLNC